MIDRLGLGDCFEQVIDSAKVGVEKPDPRIFHVAAEALQVAPANSLYVGASGGQAQAIGQAIWSKKSNS